MNMNMRTQNIGEVSMVKYKGFGDLKWFQGAGIGIGDRGPEAFKLHYLRDESELYTLEGVWGENLFSIETL